MMRYRIRHATEYQYGHPVSVCHNQLRLTPKASDRLTVHESQLSINPEPTTRSQRMDSFGNVVDVFSIEHAHEALSIVATSQVTVHAMDEAAVSEASKAFGPWTKWKRQLKRQAVANFDQLVPHLLDSPHVHLGQKVLDYALSVVNLEMDLLAVAKTLTTAIHRDFTYDPKATNVQTTSDQAFDLKAGVCQDLAHVQIACLRSMGLPARYVSGYLRTIPPKGQPGLVGADESHAWLALHAGPDIGWIDVDPTNDCLAQTDHIPLAHGRDYADIAPVRGVYIGGGQNLLKVSVDVAPINGDGTPWEAAEASGQACGQAPAIAPASPPPIPSPANATSPH